MDAEMRDLAVFGFKTYQKKERSLLPGLDVATPAVVNVAPCHASYSCSRGVPLCGAKGGAIGGSCSPLWAASSRPG
eukprot:9215649-Pyramimonas_sp.AAC.1